MAIIVPAASKHYILLRQERTTVLSVSIFREMSNTVSPAEVAAFFGLYVRWTIARSGIVENREIMAITRREMLDIVRRAPQVSAVEWDNAVNEILSYVDENLSPDHVVEEPPAHWPRGGERGGREGGDPSHI